MRYTQVKLFESTVVDAVLQTREALLPTAVGKPAEQVVGKG